MVTSQSIYNQINFSFYVNSFQLVARLNESQVCPKFLCCKYLFVLLQSVFLIHRLRGDDWKLGLTYNDKSRSAVIISSLMV